MRVYVLPDRLTDVKEVIEITENFKKNKDLDYLAKEFTKVAKVIGTYPHLVWQKWSEEINEKEFGKDGYRCEEEKTGKGECWKCKNLMHDSILHPDATCRGNSIVATYVRLSDPNYKPPHFEDAGPIKVFGIKQKVPWTGFEPATF